VNVLRDAMAVDSLDACGVYFGTTGGQVYASADAGDTWTAIVRDLPAVLSVEVQTLAFSRARRTSRTSRPTRGCRRPWPTAASRSWWSARWLGGERAVNGPCQA
jgi:hypothetical protein